MCHEAGRRNTDNDQPSEQSNSESRPRSASNAAGPQHSALRRKSVHVDYEFTPVRLAASEESGKDSLSLKMYRGLQMSPPKPDMERSADKCEPQDS